MKKYLVILLLSFLVNRSGKAQDFVLNNPVMGPVTPAPFPGMLTTTFDFYVAGASFNFSSDPLSNYYSTITFSFTKLNPTNSIPSGTGSSLFNWVLTNNGGVGVAKVYTWTGTTNTGTMSQSPPHAKYHITFTNAIITYAATQAQADVRVAGQFTDPGAAPTGNSGNNSSSIATYTAAGSPLPIQLLSFIATKQSSEVLLNWQTSSELNTNHFEVEFSKDGNQWQAIGNLSAAGSSSIVSSYSMIHNSPVKGANYYRLALVDNDGKIAYSPIRVVNFNSKGSITILPNPVIDKVYITAGADVQIESVRLINSKGQLLQNLSKFQSGSSIDMSNYSAGTYILKVTDQQGNVEVRQLLKQSL